MKVTHRKLKKIVTGGAGKEISLVKLSLTFMWETIVNVKLPGYLSCNDHVILKVLEKNKPECLSVLYRIYISGSTGIPSHIRVSSSERLRLQTTSHFVATSHPSYISGRIVTASSFRKSPLEGLVWYLQHLSRQLACLALGRWMALMLS